LAREFFDPDFCWHGGSVGTIQVIDAHAEVMRQFFAALPDAEAIEQDADQDGGRPATDGRQIDICHVSYSLLS
jgi:hypothetical protein